MEVAPQFEFHHVGISVPDLEVAARWWEHMFGFKITKRFRIEPANADVILLPKGNLNVELFQASGAAPLPHDRRIPIKDIGTHGTKHAAFRINNLDEFLVAVQGRRRGGRRTQYRAWAYVLSARSLWHPYRIH